MSDSAVALDLEALLAPVAGANAAGSDLRYETIYDKIKTARRAADDTQYGRSAHSDAHDGLSPEERAAAARVQWLAVGRQITEVLTAQSKDLQLAVWLLEAETYVNAFAGAEGVLTLIQRLIEQYWDVLFPPIEEDEEPLALRVGAMDWVNERLPGILKGLPLSSGAQKYTLAHYELAEKATDEKAKAELAASGRPTLEQFGQIMAASTVPHLETLSTQLDKCLAAVVALEQSADARFVSRGDRPSPLLSFSQVRKTIEEAQFHVGRALRSKGQRPGSQMSTAAGGAATTFAGNGDGIWDRALQLVMQGQLEGLRLAQSHIEAAASGRERFLRQLQLSELCLQAGMDAFAYPILDELGKLIDARNLATWEDAEVIRRTWSGLASVCRSMGRLRPESVARETEAQQRLSALAGEDQNVAPEG